jgi:CRISPR-associated protein Csx10
VLCTQLDGEPNSASTFGYVPGSVLRGALVARYAAAKGLADGAAIFKDAGAQQAFFAADVRYLNAYPCVGDVRALPVSQAWFRDKHKHREKGDGAPIYDAYVSATPAANKRVAGDDDSFVVAGTDGAVFRKARRQVAIHTLRDRNAGRATEKFGAVFRYEALAPGQMLRAHVLVGDAGAEILKKLLIDDADVFLGKARTAGYGRARAQLVGDDARADQWRESPAAPSSGPWRLTLLSDALLRDSAGALGAGSDALRTALADATGVNASEISVEPRFVAVRTVGGFNRTWGLPLPQAPAARMGSEYEVTCAEWKAEHLRLLEQRGVGERCSDGFGRVALRAPGGAAELSVKKVDAATAGEGIQLNVNTPAHALAKQMAERLLRRQLDRLVMAQAQEISARVTKPSVSQLKRMQAVVNDALTELLRSGSGKPVQRLRKYMDSLNQRASVRSMFTSGGFAQVNNAWLRNAADLHEWLNKRFSNEDKDIDKILGIHDGLWPKVGGVKAEMTEELQREYSLRLVHAVLGLAAKRKRNEGDERR